MIRAGALLLTISLLAACQTKAPAPEPASAPPERNVQTERMDPLDRMNDTCGLSPLKRYLGSKAAELPANMVSETTRIVSPGTQVTMDYVPRRLNILTSEDDTIIGLKCG